MKNAIFLAIVLSVFMVSGCSGAKYNLTSLAGANIRDLEAAKSSGISRTFNMEISECFQKTMSVLKNENLTVFLSSEKRGYIVAMGLYEQVDTTRIGIFFEKLSDNSTKITLSSLSQTALPKAEKIIFGGLS